MSPRQYRDRRLRQLSRHPDAQRPPGNPPLDPAAVARARAQLERVVGR